MLSGKINDLSIALTDFESIVRKLNNGLRDLNNFDIECNTFADLNNLKNELDQNFKISLNSSINCLRAIDSLKSIPKSNTVSKNVLPPQDDALKMVTDFFNQKISKAPTPLPMNAGCYSHRYKKSKQNQIICGAHEETERLMITCNCTEETQICYAFDPSTYPKFKIIPLKKNEWSPLPTIIPEHPSPRYEHPKGAKVLSLWMNQESNQWSSIFYTATVSKRPCDRYKNDTEDRGYELTFFDGTTQVVPEKFIVSSKDKW